MRPMTRESAGAGAGRLAGAPFLGACLLPRDRLAGMGLSDRCFVPGPLERCSTRMLSEPTLPAALLTREVLLASILGPTRPCFLCSFLLSSAAMLILSFLQGTRKHLYDSAYVPEKQEETRTKWGTANGAPFLDYTSITSGRIIGRRCVFS